MNRAASPFLLALASLLAPACSYSAVDIDSEHWILGRWLWIESTGGLMGDTRTPDSEGFSLELEFRQNGDLLLYRNGSLETSSSFEIEETEEGPRLEKGAPILGTEELLVFLLDEHLGRPAPWDQDRMVLVERCDDCYTHEFERR